MDLMKVKENFFMGLFIENGLNTRFWEDTWLRSAPMPQHYPTLHVIAQQK
jgi:hypothetical protein